MSAEENPRMAELIEASSLGTPEAKRLRESVPAEVGAEIVRRAKPRDVIALALAQDDPCRCEPSMFVRQAGLIEKALTAAGLLVDGAR